MKKKNVKVNDTLIDDIFKRTGEGWIVMILNESERMIEEYELIKDIKFDKKQKKQIENIIFDTLIDNLKEV